VALDPASIAGSIAGLSVSGVSILTPATLKPQLQARDCPVIYPAFEFVAGLTDQVTSLGLAGAAMHQYRYNLNYYYAPIRQRTRPRSLPTSKRLAMRSGPSTPAAAARARWRCM